MKHRIIWEAKILDMYIKWTQSGKTKQIRLPVLPSSFTMSNSQNNTSVMVHNFGELNLKGKRGLWEITIDSFFPKRKCEFEHGTHQKRYNYYIRLIKKLFENNTTVIFLITGTTISFNCTITDFSYGEEDGTGDVSYSITFKEYRETAVKELKNIQSKKRITMTAVTGAYKWKKGDTWPKVCKKKLGTSKNWKKVRKSNLAVIKKAKKKYPKKKEILALVGYKVVIE